MNKADKDPVYTMLTLTVGFIFIAYWTKTPAFLFIAVITGITGLTSLTLSKALADLWMKLAWMLSLVVPKILLSVIFFGVLFPISLLSRLFSKADPLQIKTNPSTTFLTVNKSFNKRSFENPW